MELVLDHIVLNVRDVEAALTFYTRVLGLTPERVEEYRRGHVPFPSVRLSKNTILDLLPEQWWSASEAHDEQRTPNMNHFCMAMEKQEWQDVCDKIALADVAVDKGPMNLFGARGDGVSIYVTDPAGNRVELRYYEP